MPLWSDPPLDDPASIYDAIDLTASADRPFMYINMVASLDGRAQIGGSSAGLGSSVDQAILRRLRARADCVLLGAGTVAVDAVYAPLAADLVAARRRRGQVDQPLWAIVTASGNLPADAAVIVRPERRPVIFVAARTPSDRQVALAEHADVVVSGASRPDPVEIARVLRQRYGCELILAEGGPTLNRSLLAANVVDELFLTVAPKLVGGPGKTIVDGGQLGPAGLRLDLVSIYEHAGELFVRYRITQGATTGA